MKLQDTLTDILADAVERGETPGVNLMVRRCGEEVLYTQAGMADREERRSIRRDSIFRLYSQSKPITAAAVMLLVERGRLDLLEPVELFLPGFHDQKVWTPDGLVPAVRPVRVMDLMGMTAGLCYPGPDEPALPAASLFEENQKAIATEADGLDTVAFADALGRLPLAFQPGASFRYSTCADVLGAVVEVVSGKRFGDFLREELFEPLGMKDTDFWVPPEKQRRLVTVYEHTPDGLAPWHRFHLCVGRYDRRPAFESGGAGLVSTLEDYAAFADMLLAEGSYRGQRILSPESVRYMARPQLMPGPQAAFWDNLDGYSYGKLMRVCVHPGQVAGLTRLDEYGWDGWLGAHFANFPHEQMTFLLMQNITDAGTAPVTRKCRNALLAAESMGELS